MYLKLIAIQVILINVVLINAFDIPEPIRKGIMDLHVRCAKSTQVNIEHIHKCDVNHIPDDPDAKCYFACLHENATVDLNKKMASIENIEMAISDDIHRLIEHIRKNCPEENFSK